VYCIIHAWISYEFFNFITIFSDERLGFETNPSTNWKVDIWEPFEMKLIWGLQSWTLTIYHPNQIGAILFFWSTLIMTIVVRSNLLILWCHFDSVPQIINFKNTCPSLKRKTLSSSTSQILLKWSKWWLSILWSFAKSHKSITRILCMTDWRCKLWGELRKVDHNISLWRSLQNVECGLVTWPPLLDPWCNNPNLTSLVEGRDLNAAKI
jgi:hypothetical protein